MAILPCKQHHTRIPTQSMRRSEPKRLGALLKNLIEEEPELAQGLYRERAIAFFWERFAPMRPFVRDIFFRNNTLHIQLRSSAAAQTISDQKENIMQLINQELHYRVIEEIRIF